MFKGILFMQWFKLKIFPAETAQKEKMASKWHLIMRSSYLKNGSIHDDMMKRKLILLHCCH